MLVHDRDARRVDGVLDAEVAALDHRDSHRLEIVFVHHRRQNRDVVLAGRELKPFRRIVKVLIESFDIGIERRHRHRS